MVSMCSGCDVYPTWAAVVVGSLAGGWEGANGVGPSIRLGLHWHFGPLSVSGLVFLSVRSAVLRCRWDDPLDAVAVHMGGGSLGVAAVHVFAAGAGILWQVRELAALVMGPFPTCHAFLPLYRVTLPTRGDGWGSTWPGACALASGRPSGAFASSTRCTGPNCSA